METVVCDRNPHVMDLGVARLQDEQLGISQTGGACAPLARMHHLEAGFTNGAFLRRLFSMIQRDLTSVMESVAAQ